MFTQVITDIAFDRSQKATLHSVAFCDLSNTLKGHTPLMFTNRFGKNHVFCSIMRPPADLTNMLKAYSSEMEVISDVYQLIWRWITKSQSSIVRSPATLIDWFILPLFVRWCTPDSRWRPQPHLILRCAFIKPGGWGGCLATRQHHAPPAPSCFRYLGRVPGSCSWPWWCHSSWLVSARYGDVLQPGPGRYCLFV